MSSLTLPQSLESGGPHHALAQLAGEWQGTMRLWFEPTTLVHESPSRATLRPVLGGSFLLLEYDWSYENESRQGLMLVGYDLSLDRYTGSWVDTFHTSTAIMAFRGDRPGQVSMLTSYGEPGAEWGWRTELVLEEAEVLLVRHFNIPPGTDEYLAVEFRYRPVA